MSDSHSPGNQGSSAGSGDSPVPAPKVAPLSAIERRILGVLMEKARTTPDAYPLTANNLLVGCNQKTSRSPVMNLTAEEIEDALDDMRQKQLVTELHSGGRVPKFRHHGYDYMGVKGAEVAVMIELLLRGEQTIGELRTRASRIEPIADLDALQQILGGLIQRGLVVELTPPGRGQLVTHNLYQPQEMQWLLESVSRQQHTTSGADGGAIGRSRSVGLESSSQLASQVAELRALVSQLQQRIEALEQRM
ncbi:MAG: DUF480 domain-containing protein [Pirellulaceae bacterium]|nr:DUF480 domain-containing protein [Pirellulaceae bacterium]